MLTRGDTRAQFFILTAVILSVLLFSLAFTVNEVVSVERQNRFYDYSSDVQREAKNVIDYQVYQGFQTESELDDFVDLLKNDFRDQAIDSNFMIIYGNDQSLTIQNLGTSGIQVGDTDVLYGASETLRSNIRIGGITRVTADNFRDDEKTQVQYYTEDYVTQINDECSFTKIRSSCDSWVEDYYSLSHSSLTSEEKVVLKDTCAKCIDDDSTNDPVDCYGLVPSDSLTEAIDSCVVDEFGLSVDDAKLNAVSAMGTIFDSADFSDEAKNSKTLTITFDSFTYDFEISPENQVIFIIQRNIDDETYVDVRT